MRVLLVLLLVDSSRRCSFTGLRSARDRIGLIRYIELLVPGQYTSGARLGFGVRQWLIVKVQVTGGTAPLRRPSHCQAGTELRRAVAAPGPGLRLAS
jgi:hypothetical protein